MVVRIKKKNAAGSHVPQWMVRSTRLSPKSFLCAVVLLVWSARKNYVVASNHELAQFLGWKDETITKLARELEQLGLFTRRTIGASKIWIINSEMYLSGTKNMRWNPDALINPIKDHLAVLEQYRNDLTQAECALQDAEIRVLALQTQDLKYLPDIVEMHRRHDELQERKWKAIRTLEQLEKQSAPKDDYYWRLAGQELHAQMCLENIEVDLNNALYYAKESKNIAYLHVQNLKAQEYREDIQRPPLILQKPLLRRGKYCTIPKKLIAKDFRKKHKIRCMAGPVRLALLICCEARGKMEYFTKVKKLAAGLDVSDDSIGRWMKTLCAAGIIRVEYAFGFRKTEGMTYKMKSGKPVVAGLGVTVNRERQIIGVLITVAGNRGGGNRARDYVETLADNVVYREAVRRGLSKSREI